MADVTSGEGGSLEIGIPTGSARSRPDGTGTVGAGDAAEAGAVETVRGGRGRGTRGGVLVRLADGQGAPPGPKPHSSAAGDSAPAPAAVLRRIRAEMRPEGGKPAGGARSPGSEGTDAAGSVIAADSAPCEVLDGEGACWATVVAASDASADPVPPSEGTAKTEEKAVSAAGKNYPRPGRRSSVVTAAVTRAI